MQCEASVLKAFLGKNESATVAQTGVVLVAGILQIEIVRMRSVFA